MKNYLKLVNFEFNRIAKIFAVLLGITLVVQITGVIVLSKNYLNMANEKIYEEFMPKAEFLVDYGQMSFLAVTRSMWFFGPIALCIAGVGFYIFLIWYRDWFGKNTFIYRLLMLPTTRLNVFYAKITNILLATFGFVAFQLILIPLETMVFRWMLPKEFRVDMSIKEIVSNMPELHLLFPTTFLEMIVFYGAGVMVVSILFTAILFERSYKWKGIFVGILFSLVAVAVLISPLLLQEFVLNDFFYPLELFVFEIVMGVIVLTGSIWMSGFLLKNKITV
ncbi:hypothetical protein CSV71_15600 [Sporosarcina sp. P21c]|uniref:hypothetical protein n=1 Tax=unclassified Sporosarcina TaxID=2647733 RepID=UPI000C1633CF|nr:MULTISPECIES: hypothetical protein [unclassified Sporosarcina]PIC65970.1 hypothetical protein CSV78_15065 [Sporosarcina sp. P16a]PIC81889.1 hypothetical protein CSV73_15390 [Sporosarcina sp. P1]PIC88306.1 hypothetical protein CSV71_15600 [Sporosarcina sp. P21c]PIC91486.1 hypothetical protein CSV70_15495 [Sporosarcina sp. P25]